MSTNLELVTLPEAARITGKTPHNIRDYLQRQRIGKYNHQGELIERARSGELRVSLKELQTFLSMIEQGIDKHHQAGLHPELGFHQVSESQRTKHVHRLHPYLGKFIPQLVEWFLSRYFKPNQVILDPFMGSGTTLVQGNEMKMHTIGIEISPFNCLIAQVKTQQYDLPQVSSEILEIEQHLTEFSKSLAIPTKKLEQFKKKLLADCQSDYLNTWFAPNALLEMWYYRHLIPGYQYEDLLRVLLSRAVRSSRLVPHYDLATPKQSLPVGQPYWCRKHQRYCTPIDNCQSKIHAYSADTVRRLMEFDSLRSNRVVKIIQGDSRQVNLKRELVNTPLANRLIDGVFTSPPYVGQIDYHDQHRYAYELFGFPRQDSLEVGPKKRGKSKLAQQEYVEGIAEVFQNVLPWIKPKGKILVVANDRFQLYPDIAKLSGLTIVEQFQRAVTKRTEQGDDPYQETIFLMMKKP